MAILAASMVPAPTLHAQASAPGTDTAATAVEATTPAQPGDARALRYSRSAGEVFWQRAERRDLRYEVSRDGVVLGLTDGTSFYDATVDGGEARYTIVAIDEAGGRSGPASIRLIAHADSIPADVPDAAALAPRNVTIDTYSGTAAELFWVPATGAFAPVATEIRRDGVLLATRPGAQARSFFDDARSPGARYMYELTAIAADGTRAGTTFSEGGIAGESPGPVNGEPTPSAHQLRQLDALFSILRGDAPRRLARTVVRLLAEPEAAGLVVVGTSTIGFDRTPSKLFACPSGGTLELGDPVEPRRDRRNAEIQDCTFGTTTLSVRGVELTVFSSESGIDLSLGDGGSGGVRLKDTLAGTAIEASFVAGRLPSGNVSVFAAETPIDDLFSDELTVVLGPDNDYGVGFVALPVDGNGADNITGILPGIASLDVPIAFTGDPAAPTAGRATLAGSFATLEIEADNGDATSFDVTIERLGDDGRYTVRWSDRFSLED